MGLTPRSQTLFARSNAGRLAAYYDGISNSVEAAIGFTDKVVSADGGIINKIFSNIKSDLNYVKRKIEELKLSICNLDDVNKRDVYYKSELMIDVVAINAFGKKSIENFLIIMGDPSLIFPEHVRDSLLGNMLMAFSSYEDIIPNIIDYLSTPLSKRRHYDLGFLEAGSNVIKGNFGGGSRVFSPKDEKLKDVGDVVDKEKIVHPGIKLNEILEELGWTVADSASLFGITREHLYRVLRGDNNISPELAKALARNKVGGQALDWLILQAKYDLAQPDRPKTRRPRATSRPKA